MVDQAVLFHYQLLRFVCFSCFVSLITHPVYFALSDFALSIRLTMSADSSVNVTDDESPPRKLLCSGYFPLFFHAN